jgi:hypothetical protein
VAPPLRRYLHEWHPRRLVQRLSRHPHLQWFTARHGWRWAPSSRPS